MPQTYRDYSVREVALCVADCSPINGNERKQAGDIITIRKPGLGIGKNEASAYLWLRIEGPDADVLDSLSIALMDYEDRHYDKRRYCIPLSKLHKNINLARVQDTNDIYQPFLPIDEDNLLFLINSRPALKAEGLVFDKQTGKYL